MPCVTSQAQSSQNRQNTYVRRAAIDLYSIQPAWNEAITGLEDEFEFLHFQQCKSKPRTIHYYDALSFKMLPTSLKYCCSCRPFHSYRDWLDIISNLVFCKIYLSTDYRV